MPSRLSVERQMCGCNSIMPGESHGKQTILRAHPVLGIFLLPLGTVISANMEKKVDSFSNGSELGAKLALLWTDPN